MTRRTSLAAFLLILLLAGVPALPAAPPLEPCFAAMGFASIPQGEAEVKEQYWRLAKVMHPDAGGDEEAFKTLNRNYEACLELVRNAVKE